MPSLKRLSPNMVVLHHEGKFIRYGEYTNLYRKFQKLNPKDKLIEKAKNKLGITTNPLQAGFILEDGTLLQLGQKNNHSEILKVVNGFSKFMDCHIKSFVILCFFIWHTNSIRILVRPENTIAAQIWSHEDITVRQWKKLDKIINMLHSSTFYFDIVAVLHRETRYFQEVRNPHNSLIMRKAYEYAKKELEKGIPHHLNHT